MICACIKVVRAREGILVMEIIRNLPLNPGNTVCQMGHLGKNVFNISWPQFPNLWRGVKCLLYRVCGVFRDNVYDCLAQYMVNFKVQKKKVFCPCGFVRKCLFQNAKHSFLSIPLNVLYLSWGILITEPPGFKSIQDSTCFLGPARSTDKLKVPTTKAAVPSLGQIL